MKPHSIVAFGFLYILQLISDTNADDIYGRCPHGWTDRQQSGFCYQFNRQLMAKTWVEAQGACEAQSGDLVSIQNEDEGKWLDAELQRYYSEYKDMYWWTGMNKLSDGQTWRWSDGISLNVNLLKWDSGYPTIKDEDKCVNVFYTGRQIRNVPCTRNYGYICKRSKSVPIPCDSDNQWQHGAGQCFKIIQGTDRTWSQCQQECQLMQSNLATVLNEESDIMVYNIMRKSGADAWIGLKSFKDTNNPKGYSWRWANGSNIGYTAWYSTPQLTSGTEDTTCARSRRAGGVGDSWDATQCTEKYSCICSKEEGQCAPGWQQKNGKCYLAGSKKLPWSNAREECNLMGAELINVRTSDTQELVRSLIDTFASSGIDYVWMGMWQKAPGMPLEWTLGSQVATGNFNNWGNKEPSINALTTNCGRITTRDSNGKWSIAPRCSDSNGYICEIPLHKQPVRGTRSPVTKTCGQGWKLWKTHCYKFATVEVTWPAARVACALEGGDLVDIRSQEELQYIESQITDTSWIGLNDRVVEGSYRWNDDTQETQITNWNTGEPNNQGDENCVEMYGYDKTSPSFGKWNDLSCGSLQYYICKKHSDPSTVTSNPLEPTPGWTAKCGPFWVDNTQSEYCYQFNLGPLTWNDAAIHCEAEGGALVSIPNKIEQNFIASQTNNAPALSYWNGLNCGAIWGYWRWRDGSAVSYSKWANGKPDNSYSHTCVSMDTLVRQWDDKLCTDRNAYICWKRGQVTTAAPTRGPEIPSGKVLGCDVGYIYFNGRCFKVSTTQITWSAARSACIAEGGELASIHSQRETAIIVSFMALEGADVAWIGLKDQIPLSSEMEFKWSDGSRIDFSNWNYREPNNLNSNEDCVEINWSNGRWNDNSCTRTFPYVCAKKAIITDPTPTPPTPSGCPFGYQVHYGESCYKFATSSVGISRTSAEGICNQDGGHLTHINSHQEQFIVHAQAIQRGLKDSWIGLERVGSSGSWYKWSNGDFISYTNWDQNRNGNQACGYMKIENDGTGQWTTLACDALSLVSYVCEKVIGVRTTVPTVPPGECLAGWTTLGANCYRAFTPSSLTDRKTWDEARAFCIRLNGDLASIPDSNTNANMRLQVSNNLGESLWIGLNNRDRGGYIWSDESGVSFENWKDGQPDNHNNQQQCVHIDYSDLKWSTENCFVKKNWICKVRKELLSGSTLPPMTTPSLPSCGNGYRLYKGFCYKVFGDSQQSSTWQQALATCQGDGGNLVSLHNTADNNFILSLINGFNINFWIGFNQLGFQRGFKWSDNTVVDFLNWGRDQPSDSEYPSHCVSINAQDGFWYDWNCGSTTGFVCKRANTTVEITTTPRAPIVGYCPSGFQPVGNKCYKFYSTLRSWSEARDACAAVIPGRTFLASLSNDYEQSGVTATLRANYFDMWIGLYRTDYNQPFLWLDNSEFTFDNWARGEPSGTRWNPENCVEMFGNGHFQIGSWNDISCSTKRPYLCMALRDPYLPTPWPTRNLVTCPVGFVSYYSYCYMFVNAPQTWSQASSGCSQYGATLVSVHDLYEHSFIHFMTSTRVNNAVWIGLNDQTTPGTYVWSNGYPLTFTHWGEDQPSLDQSKTCVEMEVNGRWTTVECNHLHPYVCSINYGPVPTTVPTIEGTCPNDKWVPFGSHCYYFEIGKTWSERVDFEDAQVKCRDLDPNARLVSINSQLEMNFIRNQYNQRLSGEDARYLPNLWIGLYRQASGDFAWLDNSPVGYVNWASGEPNGNHNTEPCVELYSYSGDWNDCYCSSSKAYICKTYKTEVTRPSTLKPTTTRRISTNPPRRSTRDPNVPITAGPTFPVVTYATPPMLKPNEFEKIITSLTTTGKNDGLVAGLILFVLALMILASVGFVCFSRRRGSNVGNGGFSIDNVSYRKDDSRVDLDKPENPPPPPPRDHETLHLDGFGGLDRGMAEA